jgi:hypothetical protein
MNKKEFEIWHKQCEWFNINEECGITHEKCDYYSCPNVLIFERVNERVKELEKK